MILYFDSYITDIPLSGSKVISNEPLRQSCKNYSMPSKIDITKYTLASYAHYHWDEVLIRYEVDKISDYEMLDIFILDLYPHATIMHKRSDSFAAFQESLDLLNSYKSNWIFYAGNNDQPWIGSTSKYLKKLISIASDYEKKYDFISILYTHYSETFNLNVKDTPMNLLYGRDIVNIDENADAKIILRKKGDNTSAQIVNKKLFNEWFSTNQFPSARVIRSEDIRDFFIVENQLMIIPKKEICAHFDGYSHTAGTSAAIGNYQVPPLFIPQGFFSNDIKISYGYNEYRSKWVNINPTSENYIFESDNGTDLKIDINSIPLFWSERISKLDINKNIDEIFFKKMIARNINIVQSPWKISNKKFKVSTIFFLLRYFLLLFWIKSSLVKLTHNYGERRDFLKKFFLIMRKIKNIYT